MCHNAVALRRVSPPVPMNDGVGECNTSKTESHKSRAVMPSMRKPASKDVTSGSVELCDTAVCFLRIQLIGRRSTSEDAQKSSRCPLQLFKISCKIGILKQSQSAWFGSDSHMTTLPEITRVVKVRNETSSASVTGSRPLCDCSCQLVYTPQNIRSADAR